MPKNAVVIGGGISGLACAYRLQQLGVPVTLFETQAQAGGLIGTAAKDGFLFESGPQSFQGTDPLLDLVAELGIREELCQANPRAPRFVLRHGRLQKLPMSPPALLTSSLLSPGARWRVIGEPFRRTKPPSAEESIADFVRRKFGEEILEYLVAPFVSGIHAGDPEKLSLSAAFPALDEWERTYGSVLRGAMKSRPAKGKRPPTLCSFTQGIATLASALSAKLGANLRTGTTVLDLNLSETSGGASYDMHVDSQDQKQLITTQLAIIATPAYTASHLLGSVSETIARMLSEIPYAGVGVVAAGYDEKQLGQKLDGFGFLVPRSEKFHTLGTVWNSALFPGRSPGGKATMTSFVGGATNPAILDKSAEEIAGIVQGENSRILGISGPPVASSVWKHPRALPQYALGHGRIVEAVRDAERRIPGLFFSGNYLEGSSLGKCIEQGFRTAEAARNHLASRA